MDIKTVTLGHLKADPTGLLTECADSGSVFVVELPDRRLVAIQSLEAGDDDNLVNDLIETNQAFREMVVRSKAGALKPFPLGLED